MARTISLKGQPTVSSRAELDALREAQRRSMNLTREVLSYAMHSTQRRGAEGITTVKALAQKFVGRNVSAPDIVEILKTHGWIVAPNGQAVPKESIFQTRS